MDNDKDRISALERELSELRGMVKALMELYRESYKPTTVQTPTPTETRSHVDLTPFTPKQHAVLQLLCDGKSTAEMSGILCVTESTIKVHLRSIMDKREVRTRALLAIWYSEVMANVDPVEYEKRAGIPLDWHIHHEEYREITAMLQAKVR